MSFNGANLDALSDLSIWTLYPWIVLHKVAFKRTDIYDSVTALSGEKYSFCVFEISSVKVYSGIHSIQLNCKYVCKLFS